jgi:hypothetical protein
VIEETRAPETETLAPYAIVQGGRSRGSNSSALAVDRDLDTVWEATGRGATRRAFAWFDIGDSVPVSAIRIYLTQIDEGVTITVDCSNDRDNWTPIELSTPLEAGAWNEIAVGQSCRYVRFSFEPTGNETSLGHIAEIELLP